MEDRAVSGLRSSRPGPRRRTVVAAIGALAAAGSATALTSCSVPAPRRTGPVTDPAPGIAISDARPARLMQILAHPDDDLYFMNPDTQRMLDSGVPLVCVYVTAGEANGVNKAPGRPRPAADKSAYSSARHQGLRQAYATLLGLPKYTDWQKDITTLRGGRRAEINSLAVGPRRVDLIHLNLAMHTTRHARLGMPNLWRDRVLELPTVVADDSPVRTIESYDYDRLVDVLVGLMDRYRPTVVQTLDPDPDIQHSDEVTRKKDSEQRGYSDHGDHTAVASFSWAAMARWVAESARDGGEIPAFVATSFRGYYNRHWPKNLPDSMLRRKAGHLVPYGGEADWSCGNSGGCGDYNVGGERPLTNKKGWVRSTHHRYPGARTALAAEPDGRLTAYGVLGLRAVRWRETEAGSGRWGQPADLGGGPLAPTLGRAALDDGRQLLFALRFSAISGHGGNNAREIVLLEQRSAGGPFLGWRGLGNPERHDDRGRRIGVPVAVTAPDGRVHLFVRNADKGVSTRVREADGRWSGWRTLDGSAEIQDGLTTVVDAAGRVHLFGAGFATVHHWTQDAPGLPLTHRPGGHLPAAVDTPAALARTDGSVHLLYRTERPWKRAAPRDSRGSASPALTRFSSDGRLLPAVRFDGYGPLATAGDPERAVLLGLDLRGRVQLRHEGRLMTRTAGAVALDTPALDVTPAGEVRVVGMGPDAHPWTWSPGTATATG
ncbi:PIG-L family deacetylase [Streptomyces sp. Tu 2975]|uniref:PIG-L family deacetylase n=1 Tax=Streptomyces sp. Tu 2975 TaxID=2676871 RepID=UPI001FC9934B|nr:PIG-L family deacetylase [Streptomyces sp. Tu 2975]